MLCRENSLPAAQSQPAAASSRGDSCATLPEWQNRGSSFGAAIIDENADQTILTRYLPRQHFLYFLPLPHGHVSFRPILGMVLRLKTPAVDTGSIRFETKASCVSLVSSFLPDRKHAHHSISSIVFLTMR